jgi:uncharacterized membrane protein YphA (DoxX/SURF4 family)
MFSSRVSFVRRIGVVALVSFLFFATPSAQGHEKWFHDSAGQPTCWCALGTARPLIAIAVVLVLTLIGFVGWRWRGKRDLIPGPRQFGSTAAGRSTFYAAVPALVAVHLAVPLLAMGMTGKLLSPNNVLTGSSRYLLGLAEIACAVAFFYGVLTRLAAVALLLIWLVGFPLAGWEPMAENFHYVGFAAFFYFCGRGPYAVDRLMFPRLEPPVHLLKYGLPCLRVAVGLGLAFVAFTEKLANPALAAAFLQEHALNFTARLHIPMCDATFALCCGAVELLVGLWIALGIFPRTIILIAFIPFNMSLTIFHGVELIGHLPFYGALALLVLWTPDVEEENIWTRALGAMAVPH